MRVYLDMVFILNFLFDFILLSGVSFVLRRNVNIKRIFLGALVGALSIFLLFIPLNSTILFIYKFIISLLMTLISFGYKSLKYTGRNLLFLYSISIILGGFLYYLNIHFSYKQEGIIFFYKGLSINFLFLLILSPIIVYIYIKQALELKEYYVNCYKVDIYFKNGSVKKFNAFLDTGNNLYDPYKNRPVILINKKEIDFSIKDEDIILVPYETVNSYGILKCFIVDKVYIVGIGIRRNVLVGISKEKIKMEGINCILHTKLMEG